MSKLYIGIFVASFLLSNVIAQEVNLECDQAKTLHNSGRGATKARHPESIQFIFHEVSEKCYSSFNSAKDDCYLVTSREVTFYTNVDSKKAGHNYTLNRNSGKLNLFSKAWESSRDDWIVETEYVCKLANKQF